MLGALSFVGAGLLATLLGDRRHRRSRHRLLAVRTGRPALVDRGGRAGRGRGGDPRDARDDRAGALPATAPLGSRQVPAHRPARRRGDQRVLDRALLPEQQVHDRHGLGEAHQLLRRAVLALPPGRPAERPSRHPVPARAGRGRRADGVRLPPAGRDLLGRHGGRLRDRVPVRPPEPPLERPPPALLLPGRVPGRCGRAGRARSHDRADRRRRRRPTTAGRAVGDRAGRAGRVDARARAAAALAARWPARVERGHLQVGSADDQRLELHHELGQLELHRLRGQAVLPRVLRRGEDDGQGRAGPRLRPGHVGVLERPEQLRHARWRSCSCRSGRTSASARWRASTSRPPPRRRTTSSTRASCRPTRPTRCATCPTAPRRSPRRTSTSASRTCR